VPRRAPGRTPGANAVRTSPAERFPTLAPAADLMTGPTRRCIRIIVFAVASSTIDDGPGNVSPWHSATLPPEGSLACCLACCPSAKYARPRTRFLYRSRSSGDANARRVIQELSDLSQDALRMSLDLGPRGLQRGAQAAKALFEVGQDYFQTGQVDAPPVILRKMFEKLGCARACSASNGW
jgi:hypothetical protein